MNSIGWSPFFGLAFIFVLLPVLSGCTPDANAAIISPQLGYVEATATNQPLVSPEEVAVVEEPPTLADLSTEEIRMGLPDEIVALMDSVDLAAGETLALTQGCVGCHALDPDVQMAGPTWHNIGNRAVTRALALGKEGPATYLYESISAPNAYVVENFQPNVMPQNYLDVLSDEDFATLIAYLLSLQEE